MKRTLLVLGFTIGMWFIQGCGTPQTVVGAKPEDQLNPAMSPVMKEARLHHHSNNPGP